MNEYEQQARDFLDKTGTKIKFRYLKTDTHFPGDTEKRDIYEIEMSRGSRKYILKFGDSTNNTEKRIMKMANIPKGYEWIAKRLRTQGIDTKIEIGESFAYHMKRKIKDNEEKIKEWQEMTENTAITPYDILASIEDRSNIYENIDDFANEMGYNKISHAIETWEAIKEESNALRMMYNDDELEMLQEIV